MNNKAENVSCFMFHESCHLDSISLNINKYTFLVYSSLTLCVSFRFAFGSFGCAGCSEFVANKQTDLDTSFGASIFSRPNLNIITTIQAK